MSATQENTPQEQQTIENQDNLEYNNNGEYSQQAHGDETEQGNIEGQENADGNGAGHQAQVQCTLNAEALSVEPVTYNVFVGDLVPEITEEDLQEKFGGCGEIQAVNVIRDNRTNQCKGYAFIHFTSAEAQAKAMTPEFNGAALRGRQCRVKLSEHKNVLFVGNLPMDLNEEEVLDAIRRLCSKITIEIRVQLKTGPPPTKKSRGFCFVTFISHPVADACKKLLTASSISGRPLNVSWAETTLTVKLILKQCQKLQPFT